jgi:hypothetical protein
MKKFLKVGIVGLLVGGLLTACGGEVEKVESSSGTPKQTEPVKEEKPEAKPTDNLKIGETVKIGDFEVTLNKAEIKPAGEYDYLETQGNEFIVVDLTVKNVGKEALDPSFVLTVKDGEGKTVQNTYSSHEKSQWADATINQLPAGDMFNAQTSFEVSQNANDFRLIVQNAMTNGQAIYKLDGIK